jgi:hypothetical protein
MASAPEPPLPGEGVEGVQTRSRPCKGTPSFRSPCAYQMRPTRAPAASRRAPAPEARPPPGSAEGRAPWVRAAACARGNGPHCVTGRRLKRTACGGRWSMRAPRRRQHAGSRRRRRPGRSAALAGARGRSSHAQPPPHTFPHLRAARGRLEQGRKPHALAIRAGLRDSRARSRGSWRRRVEGEFANGKPRVGGGGKSALACPARRARAAVTGVSSPGATANSWHAPPRAPHARPSRRPGPLVRPEPRGVCRGAPHAARRPGVKRAGNLAARAAGEAPRAPRRARQARPPSRPRPACAPARACQPLVPLRELVVGVSPSPYTVRSERGGRAQALRLAPLRRCQPNALLQAPPRLPAPPSPSQLPPRLRRPRPVPLLPPRPPPRLARPPGPPVARASAGTAAAAPRWR